MCYSLMTLIEFCALHSKLAGYNENKMAISFTFYNATMAMTRLFYMFMMPFLGYLIDQGIGTQYYFMMSISCLLISSLLGGAVYFIRARVVSFYENLINEYLKTSKMIHSFLFSFKYSDSNKKNPRISKVNKSYLIYSILIYSIQGIGILLTYYIALLNPDYRMTISQLSAIVNSLATVLLTFKLEPMLSRSMESGDGFETKFYSVYLGRILSLSFFGPTIMMLAFFLI